MPNCHLAALAFWALLTFVGTQQHHRTILASSCTKEKADSPCSIKETGENWTQVGAKKGEARSGHFACPPFLEHQRVPVADSHECNESVEVPNMQHHEHELSCVLQEMPISLEASVEEATWTQQESEAAGKAQATTKASSRREQRGRFQYEPLSGQASLGSKHTKCKAEQACDGERQSAYPSGTNPASAACSSNSGFHRRGQSPFEDFAGPSEDRPRTIFCTDQQVRGVGKAKQGNGATKGALTWSAPQEKSSGKAVDLDCNESQDLGHGMGQVHRKHPAESDQPCPDVHAMSAKLDGQLQGQADRAPCHQGGNDNCVSESVGKDSRSGGIGREHRCRGPDPSPERNISKRSPRDLGRRNGRGVGSGWTDISREQGSSQSWCPEASYIPCLPITIQSCESNPQSQSRAKRIMKNSFNDPCHIDEVLFAEKDGENRIDNSPKDSPEMNSLMCNFEPSTHHAQGRVTDVPKATTCSSPYDVADMKWQLKMKTSSVNLEEYLNSHFEWHCTDNGLSDQCAPSSMSAKTVAFQDHVEVCVFHGSKSSRHFLNIDQLHPVLRRCWTMIGNRSSWSKCQYVLQQSEQERFHFSRMQEEPKNEDAQSGAVSEGHGANLLNQVWNQIAGISTSLRRPRRIATWYLNEHQKEVCEFSRDVTILPRMSQAEFEASCRSTWSDFMQPAPLEWFVVEDPPQAAASIVAHVIIVQNRAVKQQVHLIHWDRWPILGKFRATMFPVNEMLHNVMQQVQAAIPRSAHTAVYAMHCKVQGRTQHFDQEDRIQVDNSAVMYAYLQHVPIHDDSNSSSNEESDASTTEPSDESTDWHSDETGFMQAGQAITQFDAFGPFPWQHDMPDDEIEEEEPEENEFSPHVTDMTLHQMRQQIAYLQATSPDTPEPWVAVTFGIGLTHLGRRDVDFTLDELHLLPQKIGLMWHDFAQYGEATLYFVTPQPEGMHVRKNIVFVVSIGYGAEHDLADRKVLVREASSDDTVVSQFPYAAQLLTGMTPRAMLSQLRHHECFPFGIRDCSIRLAGKWLDTFEHYEVSNGDLCDVMIGTYPEHVSQAYEQMADAESMFQVARAHYDNKPDSTMLTLRVHGISPSNVPLGHRVMWMDFPDMANLEWIPAMKQLWPFREEHAVLQYVVKGVSMDEYDEDRPILHFVLSYVTNPEGAAVLIKQSMFAVHEMTTHSEIWATVIPRQADEKTIMDSLQRYPFWFHPQVRTHVKKDDAALRETDNEWQNGDVIGLKFNVMSREKMLVAMLEMENRKNSPQDDRHIQYDEDEATLFQLHRSDKPRSNHDDDPVDRNTHIECANVPEAFIEIFHECASDRWQWNQDEDRTSMRTLGHSGYESEESTRQANQEIHMKQGPISDVRLDSLDHAIRTVLDPAWQGLNVDFELLPPLHPAAVIAIQTTAQMNDHRHGGIFHIYTDGSSKQDQAAWSFVILHQIETYHGPRFMRVGYAAGSVTTDLGPFEEGAGDAEATALIAVAEYLLSRKDLSQCEIHIHYDAQAIGAGAEGKQNIPKTKNGQNDTRAEFARITLSLVQQIAPRAQGHHVHAHEWNPFNEAADSLAQQVRTGWTPPITTVLRSKVLRDNVLKHWAWIQIKPSDELPDLGSLLSACDVLQPQAWPDVTFEVHAADSQLTSNSKMQNLKIGAVNVGTMGYRHADDAANMGLKAHELMLQFSQAEYDVICLTETRAKQSMTSNHGPFCRLISAAKQGQGGTEIWINQESITKKLKGQFHAHTDVVAWHQTHDILAVTMNLCGFMISVIACYAPQSGRPPEQIQRWWHEFQRVVQMKPIDTPVCVAGDFNGRVGSVITEGVGDMNPDVEDTAGECIRQWCQECDMFIPSTFSCYHEGSSFTFVNPKGVCSRLDYIAFSQANADAVHSTYVDDSIDVLNGDRDHKMIAMTLCIQPAKQMMQGIIRQEFYDRRSARDDQMMHTVIQDIKPKPWRKDVNEHWSEFRDELQTLCASRYPKPKRKQRRAYYTVWSQRPSCTAPAAAKVHEPHHPCQMFCNLERPKWWKSPRMEPWTSLSATNGSHHLFHQVSNWPEFPEAQKASMENMGWAKSRWASRAGKSSHRCSSLSCFAAQESNCQTHRKSQTALARVQNYRWNMGLHKSRYCQSVGWTVRKYWKSWQDPHAKSHSSSQAHDQSLDVRGPPSDSDPNVFELESAIRNLNPSKAAGLDGIGGEVYKTNPMVAARKAFPMLLKCSLRQQWIAEFAGGWLIPLHKGKMMHHLMEGHRAILLEPSLARAFSKTWRTRLEPGLALWFAFGPQP